MIHDCIPLEAPPKSVVRAIASVAATDPDAGHWAVSLEKHYQAIEKCEAAQ